MSIRYVRTVMLLAATTLTACVTNPKVLAEKTDKAAWNLQVTACSYSRDSSDAIRELERQATRRCRRGWDSSDMQIDQRVMLGNALVGECPAVRVAARVTCKEQER